MTFTTDADKVLNQVANAIGLAYGGAQVEYNRASDAFDRTEAPALFDTLQTRRTQLHTLAQLVGTLPAGVQALVQSRRADIVATAESDGSRPTGSQMTPDEVRASVNRVRSKFTDADR